MSVTLYCNQVSGSFPFFKVGGKLLKPLTESELQIYKEINEHQPKLQKFVPKFYGRTTLTAEMIASLCNGSCSGDESDRPMSQERRKLRKKAKKPSFETKSVYSEKKKTRTRNGGNLVAPKKALKKGKKRKRTQLWTASLVKKFAGERKRKIMRMSSGKKGVDDLFVFMKLQDMNKGLEQPWVLDMKVGTRQHASKESAAKKASKEKKCAETTSRTLGLRAAGLQIYDEKGESCFRDKYWGRRLNDEEFISMLKVFFSQNYAVDYEDSESECSLVTEDSLCIRKNVIQHLIGEISRLIDTVKSVNWRFYGCSVLITYDGKDSRRKPSIKIIDFSNAETAGNEGFDEGFVFGLNTLKSSLKKFMDSAQ